MSLSHLISLFRSPAQSLEYEGTRWAEVVAEGLQHQLMGQLENRIGNSIALDKLPTAVQRHFALAAITSCRRQEAALWEAGLIRRSIPISIPVVLLKGIAYAAVSDANAKGRLFSDLDILVPRSFLDEAEASLFAQGWQPGVVDEYDRKYYREWMHELPPMTHVRRQTVIDLHHAVVPVISRFSIRTELLLEDAVEISPNLFVLSPTDRIIHCAIHTVIEGESSKVLRELLDLYLLLEQHAPSENLLARVFDRAKQLGVEQLIGAPVEAARQVFSSGISRARGTIGRWLVDAATRSAEDAPIQWRMARIGLLSYSHWIKMPVSKLVPHLIRKSIKGYSPMAGRT